MAQLIFPDRPSPNPLPLLRGRGKSETANYVDIVLHGNDALVHYPLFISV